MSNIRPFDDNEVDSALCIWEEMVEKGRGAPDDATGWQKALRDQFGRHGTATMRSWAISLIRPIDELWTGLGDDGQDLMAPYDWEFVPFVLSHIEWANGGHVPATLPALLHNEVVVRRARSKVTR